MTSFGTLCWFAFVAMVVGFNVFVGNTILELRRDIQIIRKRLGAEGKTKGSKASTASTEKERPRKEEEEGTDSDTDSEDEEDEKKPARS